MKRKMLLVNLEDMAAPAGTTDATFLDGHGTECRWLLADGRIVRGYVDGDWAYQSSVRCDVPQDIPPFRVACTYGNGERTAHAADNRAAAEAIMEEIAAKPALERPASLCVEEWIDHRRDYSPCGPQA